MISVLLPPTQGSPKDALGSVSNRVELLEKEVRTLHGKLSAAYRRIAELEGGNPQGALDVLLHDLERLEKERLRREQQEAEGFGLSQAEPQKEKKKQQRGHGPRPQVALREVEETFELPQDEQQCHVCGGNLEALGEQFEESEDIHVLERQYVKRVIKRRKYRCRCNSCVVTAPGPRRVIPGGRYSNDFMIEVAVEKYLDHVPLERQVRRMARAGVEVSSQTLFDQLWALAQVNRPSYEALGQRTLEVDVLHADETRWPRLDSKKLSNWTVWTRTTPNIAHYAILSSKSTSAARQLFADYEGIIVVDGYAVYECLARDGPNLKLANCWAHTLRKFRDIEGNFPKPCRHVLGLIGELYKVEKKIGMVFPGDAEMRRERLALRAAKSKPILEEIRHWAQTEVGLPRSALGKAVRYMLARWEGLSRFLDNASIPLDNNAAERSLRGPVIGRKVHYGSKSKRGIEVAATFYTLLETAKLCGVNPVAYLRQATQAALEAPGAVLLPHDLIAQSES